MDLKANEKALYDALVKEAKKNGNPVAAGLDHINVKYKKRRVVKKVWYEYFQVGRQSKRATLLNLQKKGLVTWDRSSRQYPKIIINKLED